MKRRFLGFAALGIIACTAFGCESKPSLNDPGNKLNILKQSDASAAADGAPASGKGLGVGATTTPPPPPK